MRKALGSYIWLVNSRHRTLPLLSAQTLKNSSSSLFCTSQGVKISGKSEEAVHTRRAGILCLAGTRALGTLTYSLLLPGAALQRAVTHLDHQSLLCCNAPFPVP